MCVCEDVCPCCFEGAGEVLGAKMRRFWLVHGA